MTDLEKQIEKYQETVREYEEAREDALMVKSNFTIDVLGVLMQKLFSGVDELLESISKKESFDKNLGKTIKESIESVITEFAKQKVPNIEFKPQIKVDLSPLQSIASDISKQNKSIISLMEKMSNGNKSDELYRLIVAMVGQNKALIEKGMQINYSEQLQSISDAINKEDDKVKELTVKYFDNGKIEKVIPVYKNNK